MSGSKSMADVLWRALEDWKVFARLVCLTMTLCVAIALSIWAVVWHLPSETSEIQVGGAHIVFSQQTKDTDRFLAVVSPQGWQPTTVHVKPGAHLRIDSGGRVQIDLQGMNEALHAREVAENKIRDYRKAKKIDQDVPDEDFIIEKHFTKEYFSEEELTKMSLKWDWVGPDGFSRADMELRADPSRRRRITFKMFDEAGERKGFGGGYGALIGAFLDRSEMTETGDVERLVANAFFVGHKFEASVKEDGYLYLAVNDVRSEEVNAPNLFALDNVGLFYSWIQVTK